MKPDTIARSLAIGSPADGMFAMQVARETGGTSSGAPSRRSGKASRCSPRPRACSPRPPAASRSPTSSACAIRASIKPDEETVAYVTGNGYKTIEALEGYVEPSYHVAPDLDEFLAALNG